MTEEWKDSFCDPPSYNTFYTAKEKLLADHYFVISDKKDHAICSQCSLLTTEENKSQDETPEARNKAHNDKQQHLQLAMSERGELNKYITQAVDHPASLSLVMCDQTKPHFIPNQAPLSKVSS